nr:venom protein [Lampona murina]
MMQSKYTLSLLLIAVGFLILATVTAEENDSEMMTNLLEKESERGCIEHGKSCDSGTCCSNRICRCNTFGTNCRCGRKKYFG